MNSRYRGTWNVSAPHKVNVPMTPICYGNRFGQRFIGCLMVRATMLIGALVLASNGQKALGIPLTFLFGGHVDAVNDPGHDLDALIEVGDFFSGQYTFESTTGAFYPAGGYYVSASGSLELVVGDLQINAGPPRINVVDVNAPDTISGDRYIVSAASDSISATGGLQIVEFWPIYFYYFEHDVFFNRNLPLVPPPLPPARQRSFLIQGRGPSGELSTVMGTVETLTPEPASILCVLVGIISLCPRLQRRTVRQNHTSC